jgi:hypothetical protein
MTIQGCRRREVQQLTIQLYQGLNLLFMKCMPHSGRLELFYTASIGDDVFFFGLGLG